MANLDTRSKRASSVSILSPWMLAPVLPDGVIAQADRQHVAWSYSGIAATELVEALREIFDLVSEILLVKDLGSAVMLLKGLVSSITEVIEMTSEVFRG